MDPIDPMDPMDPRIAGWWEIKDWEPRNDALEAPRFPEEGFVRGGTLVIMKAGKAFNLFWPDQNQMPCALHYPVVAESVMTFAGNGFPCVIQTRSLEWVSGEPQTLQLTVTLSSGEIQGSTGNTGTFIAQSVPGPPPHGGPGPDEPGK